MNEIARVGEMIPAETATRESESIELLHVLERAIFNPDLEMSRLDKLLEIKRQMVEDQERARFNGKMASAQAEMVPIVRDANNTHTKSKYATLQAIDEGIRPIYTKYGFMLTFNEDVSPRPNERRIVCLVANGPYERLYHLDAPIDNLGPQGQVNKTALHGLGSLVSYLRRYLTCMIFNIAVKDDDDDGNAGGGSRPRGNAPAPTRPGKDIMRGWIDEAREKLSEPVTDPEPWVSALVGYIEGAPSAGELSQLINLDVVKAGMSRAPQPVKDRVTAKIEAARERIRGTKLAAQARPEQQREAGSPGTQQSSAGPASAGQDAGGDDDFELWLANEHGDLAQDEPFGSATAYASALEKLWRSSNRKETVLENNADSIADAMVDEKAAAIIRTMMPANSAPPPAADEAAAFPVVTVQEGRSAGWPGYLAAFEKALHGVPPAMLAEWLAVQEVTIQRAPQPIRIGVAKQAKAFVERHGIVLPEIVATFVSSKAAAAAMAAADEQPRRDVIGETMQRLNDDGPAAGNSASTAQTSGGDANGNNPGGAAHPNGASPPANPAASTTKDYAQKLVARISVESGKGDMAFQSLMLTPKRAHDLARLKVEDRQAYRTVLCALCKPSVLRMIGTIQNHNPTLYDDVMAMHSELRTTDGQ